MLVLWTMIKNGLDTDRRKCREHSWTKSWKIFLKYSTSILYFYRWINKSQKHLKSPPIYSMFFKIFYFYLCPFRTKSVIFHQGSSYFNALSFGEWELKWKTFNRHYWNHLISRSYSIKTISCLSIPLLNIFAILLPKCSILLIVAFYCCRERLGW